jgi:hypothetical protein
MHPENNISAWNRGMFVVQPRMTTISGGQQLVLPPPVSLTYRFLGNHLEFFFCYSATTDLYLMFWATRRLADRRRARALATCANYMDRILVRAEILTRTW